MDAFYQALIRGVNLLLVRPLNQSEDFEGLSGADISGRRVALSIVFLPPLPLSLVSFPLSLGPAPRASAFGVRPQQPSSVFLVPLAGAAHRPLLRHRHQTGA